jgi:hypothetical protein
MLFLLTGDDKLTPVVLLIVSAYIIVILNLLKFNSNHIKVKYNIIYCMLLIGFLVTSFGYIISSVAIYDAVTARYLVFAALSINFVISTLKSQGKTYIILILIIIIYGVLSNYSFLINLSCNSDPKENTSNLIKYFNQNHEEEELIKFLQQNNLAYGYGEYWDSNIITCLSKEKITIRPVTIQEGRILPFRLLSCERWFAQNNSFNFLIYNINRNVFINQKEVKTFLNDNPSQKVLNFKNYEIYVFDSINLNE